MAKTLALLLFVGLSLAAPTTRWSSAPIPVDHVASFTVALRPANAGTVDALVQQLSNPESERYGQYLNGAQVAALTATDLVTVERVVRALAPARCDNRGDWLRCSAAPAALADIFGTPFAGFRATDGATGGPLVVVATGPLNVPAVARDDVVFVSGLSELPVRHERPPVAAVGDSGKHMVVPDTIRLTYNVSAAPVAAGSAVPQAVAEFGGSNNEHQSDLSAFGNATGLGNLSIAQTVGPPNDPEAEITEASLDIQYLAAVGLGNANWVWNSGDWMFTLANSLAAAPDAGRPAVVSVSYAWNEAQQCHGLPGAKNCSSTDNAGYVSRTNAAFQKLALLGTTVLSASGDSGAHGRTNKNCLLKKRMHPDYPASSPFVTAVGGTQFTGDVSTAGVTSPICASGELRAPCAGSGREVVASTNKHAGSADPARITSGGGFSELTPTPSFQQAAVAAYLANGTGVPSRSLFNAAGRGYPDISALAHAYLVKLNGVNGGVDGTSAATPVVAGLVARINAHRAAKGRPAVGFLNPLLYKVAAATPQAFNDITEGNNACTESGCLCKTGFGAAPGWDAATGLGTPNFGRLLEAIDAMDEAREARFGKPRT
eukprot:g959.t1